MRKNGTGSGSATCGESLEALAQAVLGVQLLAKRGQLSSRVPLTSSKMQRVGESVIAVPACSSARTATHAQLLVISAECMAENTNNKQVRQQHAEKKHWLVENMTTELTAEPQDWGASHPAGRHKGMTDNDPDEPVHEYRSALEDDRNAKIATGRDTDTLAGSSDMKKSETQFPHVPHRKHTCVESGPVQTKFPGAPWRKKTGGAGEQPHRDISQKATPTLTRIPPAPPPPPRRSSPSHTRPVSSTTHKKNPVPPPPPPPPRCSSTSRPQPVITRTSSSTSTTTVCSHYQGLPIPPPDPKTLALLAVAPSSNKKRRDRAESWRGERWNTQMAGNHGKLAAAGWSKQKNKKRADTWTGARTETQQRRDRGKRMRIKYYKELKAAGYNVPTTGAGKIRREQKKKTDERLAAAVKQAGQMDGWYEDNHHAGWPQETMRAPPKKKQCQRRWNYQMQQSM